MAISNQEAARQLRTLADQLDPPQMSPGPSTPTPGTPAVLTGPQGATGSWRYVFADEFTGSTLDLSKWRRGFHWAANGNHHGARWDKNNRAESELQWYQPEQVSIVNGRLVFTLEKKRPGMAVNSVDEGSAPYDYVSGLVTTAPDTYGVTDKSWQRKPPTFDFLYGWAEARIKVPAGRGLWPAFWMLPTDLSWPPEIDVVETIGQRPRVSEHHYHYTSQNKDFGKGIDMGADLTADFHTYGVDWTADYIRWYVDGKQVLEFTDKANISNKRMYLLLNLAIGGGPKANDWPGPPDASTPLPARMETDWVRVWQRA